MPTTATLDLDLAWNQEARFDLQTVLTISTRVTIAATWPPPLVSGPVERVYARRVISSLQTHNRTGMRESPITGTASVLVHSTHYLALLLEIHSPLGDIVKMLLKLNHLGNLLRIVRLQ